MVNTAKQSSGGEVQAKTKKAPEFSSSFLAEFEDLLSWRRDVRHFDRRPLESGLLDQLFDLACLAPSVGNSQPWRFVRVLSAQRRAAVLSHVNAENLSAAAAYQNEKHSAYLALKLHGLVEAPEHICVFCETKPTEGSGLGRQTMPETLVYSTVLAIHTLWLAARARGVGVGWVSIMDPMFITAVLDVPPTWQLIGYLCVGYPLEAHHDPELDRTGWQARVDPSSTRFTR